MRDFIHELLFAAIGVALGILLMALLLQDGIVLPKDEWRCVEYLPGSAECALFERVGKPHE